MIFDHCVHNSVSTAARTSRREPRSPNEAAWDRTRAVTVVASSNAIRSRGARLGALIAEVQARLSRRKRRSAAGSGKRIYGGFDLRDTPMRVLR